MSSTSPALQEKKKAATISNPRIFGKCGKAGQELAAGTSLQQASGRHYPKHNQHPHHPEALAFCLKDSG